MKLTSPSRNASAGAPHHAEPPQLPADADLSTRRLHLVPDTGPQHPRHSALALWHLLSLDAPSVATAWTLFLAHVSGVILPWVTPVSMFLAVWMIYAADRLLDARFTAGEAAGELEERHRFHGRHRAAFLAGIVLASIALSVLLPRLDPQALQQYCLLAALLGAWLLLIHARPLPTGSSRRLPKELAVGIFFSAAVFIPTVSRVPALRPTLLPCALLLGSVCILNCLLIYEWEHEAGEHPESRLQAHWTTRWATRHVTGLAMAALLLSLATTQIPQLRTDLPITLACALSLAALLSLHGLRARVLPIHRRALADVALLTPLLWLAFPKHFPA